MNKLLYISIVACVFSYTNTAMQGIPPAAKCTSLEQAIRDKSINFAATTNGGHSENSVHLMLTNLKSTPLEIQIPNGTYFIPSDEGDQNLLLVEDEIIVLQPKENKEVFVDAYCMESSDGSPVKGDKMSFKTLQADSKLKQLTAHINGNKLAEHDIQSAVWAITDDEPIPYINTTDPPARNLRETVANLTNQPNTWYTMQVDRRVNAQRRIETNAVTMSGNIRLELTKKASIHEVVKDSEGRVKFSLKPAEFPRAGTWNYTFSLRVQGWQKGIYTVVVIQDGQEIKSFPFEV